VLDQWKEHKIGDPTVAERFNTYRCADHKEQVITLLQRVCTVSVEAMKIDNAPAVAADFGRRRCSESAITGAAQGFQRAR